MACSGDGACKVSHCIGCMRTQRTAVPPKYGGWLFVVCKSLILHTASCRFKAEIQWSGEHVVQKYLSTLQRDSLYKQIRSAACTTNVDQQTMEDAIDMAMMDFGERHHGTGSEENKHHCHAMRARGSIRSRDAWHASGRAATCLSGSPTCPAPCLFRRPGRHQNHW